MSGTKVIAEIPWDENIVKGVALKDPVVNYNYLAPSSRAYFNLASRLTGRAYEQPSMVRFRSFMNVLGRALKSN